METTNKLIAIRTIQDIQMINPDEIIYCMSAGRTAQIITKADVCIQTVHNLKELSKMLESPMFIRCHAKYLVNIAIPLIYDPKNRELELINKHKIKVAKDRKAFFSQELIGVHGLISAHSRPKTGL